MPPKPKVQLDKGAWQWAESTDHTEITAEHTRMAYRLNLPVCQKGSCKRNCKGNPFCLLNLGEKSWYQPVDESRFQTYHQDEDRRQGGAFVGLKNLGATCYVNTFLQLWFHNPSVRKALYEWRDPALPEEYYPNWKPDSICSHLQVIFALLQGSNRSYVDPSALIECLNLDTGEQQDAQEFSKLFLHCLETALSDSGQGKANVIEQQFCGSYCYITECQKCGGRSERPATFYELDLNIRGHSTLEASIKDFLKEEKLEGDNQYMCSICASKQNAKRAIQLKRLPEVLNLQLLRFVFDKNKGHKKKLSSFIQFPETLDMSPFLGGVTSEEGETQSQELYELSAVLIHRGPTAYSGHYIAHIREHEGGSWYKFNDEETQKMNNRKLELGKEDDSMEGGNSSEKAPKSTKGNHSSRNAYMLVYRRKSDHDNSAGSSPVNTSLSELPAAVRGYVENDNQEFEDYISEQLHVQEQTLVDQKQNHEEMREIYESLPVTSLDERWEWVTTAWLTKWLADRSVGEKIKNNISPCPHGKLRADDVVKMKCISGKGADLLFSKFPINKRLEGVSQLCERCVIKRCREIRTKICMSDDDKLFSSLKNVSHFEPGQTLYWVSRKHLRSWKKFALSEIDAQPLNASISSRAALGSYENLNSTVTTPTKLEEYDSSGSNDRINSNNNSAHSVRISDSTRETCCSPDSLLKIKSPCEGSKTANSIACPQSSPTSSYQRKEPPLIIISPHHPSLTSSSLSPSSTSPSNLIPVTTAPCSSFTLTTTTTSTLTTVASSTTSTTLSPSVSHSTNHTSLSSKSKETVMDITTGTFSSSLPQAKILEINHCPEQILSCKYLDQTSNHRIRKCRKRKASVTPEADQTGSANKVLNISLDSVSDVTSKDDSKTHIEDLNNTELTTNIVSNTSPDSVPNVTSKIDSKACIEDLNNTELTTNYNAKDVVQNIDSPLCKLEVNSDKMSPASSPKDSPDSGTITLKTVHNSHNSSENSSPSHPSENYMEQETTIPTEMEGRSRNDEEITQKEDDTESEKASKEGEDEDVDKEDEPEERFNDDILCEHGNLKIDPGGRRLVPSAVWERLLYYFPHLVPFTYESDVCLNCWQEYETEQQLKDSLRQEKQGQKELLQNLYHGKSRPRIQDNWNGQTAYVVCTSFIEGWRKFVKHSLVSDSVQEIVNAPLLCEHKQLVYGPGDMGSPDNVTRFTLVWEDEWKTLTTYYAYDVEIQFIQVQPEVAGGTSTIITLPEVCKCCLDERLKQEEEGKFNFSREIIFIRKILDGAPGANTDTLGRENGKGYNYDPEFNAPVNQKGGKGRQNHQTLDAPPEKQIKMDSTTAKSTKASRGGVNGGDSDAMLRKSNRHRKTRGEKEVIVSSSMTLKQLQKELFKLYSVFPMDQNLSLDGRSLNDVDATLQELKLYPQCVIFLKADEPTTRTSSNVDDFLSVPTTPEEGFKGTNLLGR